MFLMPSRYEPCGLNQLYSLKYGTVPIVYATGGLADTIDEFDPQTAEGTGFSFDEYNASALITAVQRAVATYRQPALWAQVQQNGMDRDYSWRASAQKYLALYEGMLA